MKQLRKNGIYIAALFFITSIFFGVLWYKDVSKKYEFAPDLAFNAIDSTRASNLHLEYLVNPIDGISNRGWHVTQDDLDIIKSHAIHGARIYLGRDRSSGLYHLIMVAVDSNYSNYLVRGGIVDDFLPCPTECPNDKPNKAIWESDLNYLGRRQSDNAFRFREVGGREIAKPRD